MQGLNAETDVRDRLASDLAQSRSRLATDFKNLLTDAEALLRATGSYGGEGLARARVKFDEQFERLKDSLMEAQSYTVEKCRQAAHATDDYVRANPWPSVGIAAAVGIIAGALISRR